MYLVTGGYTPQTIISTEVMSASGSSWSFVGNLPKAVHSLSGISVNNQIFVTGTKQIFSAKAQLCSSRDTGRVAPFV